MGDPDGYGSDLLALLVKANHENDGEEKITLEDIIDECKTFYFAGQETAASLLSWTALLLAINTDWQDKAREEVTELFGNRSPTSDDPNIGRLKTVSKHKYFSKLIFYEQSDETHHFLHKEEISSSSFNCTP